MTACRQHAAQNRQPMGEKETIITKSLNSIKITSTPHMIKILLPSINTTEQTISDEMISKLVASNSFNQTSKPKPMELRWETVTGNRIDRHRQLE